MHPKDLIRTALKNTQYVLEMYFKDMSDEDLLVRVTPNSNHMAWQLGHLILSERQLLGPHLGADTYPALPDGFDKQHSNDTAHQNPPRDFLKKAEYLDLFAKTRAATLAKLESMSDADLDKPLKGGLSQFAPTVGSMILFQADHTTMHSAQATPVRRKLGKPVLF
jgi:DinB family protein